MFLEFITKRNEKVLINVLNILLITSTKNGALIVDTDSNDYETLETYESIISRLMALEIKILTK